MSNRGRYQPSQENDSYLKNKPVVRDVKVFRFGKYKGRAILDVLHEDRGYVHWACKTVDGFENSIELRVLAEIHKPVKRVRIRKERKLRTPHVPSSSYWGTDPSHASIPDDSDPIPVFICTPAYLADALDEPW